MPIGVPTTHATGGSRFGLRRATTRFAGRAAAVVVGALVVLGGIVPAAVSAAPAPAAAPAQAQDPKVVLIVGPVGTVTERYRALAEEAAAEAERHTTNVVRVYSPDATWAAVLDALDGASVVVYLGHGNGFPSIYRDRLHPPTQNGFGLNQVAGAGDDNNRYFGEGPLASAGVRLAPNATVLLHHLCYASGNTEPGLAEGTLDDAIARVDNFAAGFLAIGAQAVVAEAHMGPAWYVRQMLTSKRTVDQVWDGSPSAHGNTLELESARSKGYRVRLDPDGPDGGYHRSIVSRPGLTVAQVRGSGGGAAVPPPIPTLAGRGISIGAPAFEGWPTTGSSARLVLPFEVPAGVRLPSDLMLGLRWTRTAPLPAVPSEPTAPPARDAGHEPPRIPPPPPPDATGTPDDGGAAVTHVAVGAAARVDGGLAVEVDAPSTPGIYEVATTILDAEGAAYDAATQKLVREIRVAVSGPIGARYEGPAAVVAAPRGQVELTLAITNTGSVAWAAPDADGGRRTDPGSAMATPGLVWRWVSLDSAVRAPAGGLAIHPGVVAVGERAEVTLQLVAPPGLGRYTLVVDMVTPRFGSLAGSGVAPAIVPVTVVPLHRLGGI